MIEEKIKALFLFLVFFTRSLVGLFVCLFFLSKKVFVLNSVWSHRQLLVYSLFLTSFEIISLLCRTIGVRQIKATTTEVFHSRM